MKRTTKLNELKAGIGEFTWGEVIKIHEIGEYAIVEYHPWKSEGCIVLSGQPDMTETLFSYYIDGEDCSQSAESLDEALAGCIAYKHEGANAQAGVYFMRMINK